MQHDASLTQLLGAWRGGDAEALNALVPLVYDHLHHIASRHLRKERADHTIQSTALINEAFLVLASSDITLNDRVHFFAVASTVMRRVLIDHARAAGRQKRGGGLLHVTLHEDAVAGAATPVSILEIDAALEKLGAIDARKARVVELHYFGGLDYEEIAAALGISAATVSRELRFAKAWMRRELDGETPP